MMNAKVSGLEFEKQLRETILELMTQFGEGVDKDEDFLTALETIEREAGKGPSVSARNGSIARDARKIRLMLLSNEDYSRIWPILSDLKERAANDRTA